MEKQNEIGNPSLDGNTKNKPALVLRAGTVKLVVWENTDKNGNIQKSITFDRIYKEGENDKEWKTTKSFNTSHLSTISRLINSFIEDAYPIEKTTNK